MVVEFNKDHSSKWCCTIWHPEQLLYQTLVGRLSAMNSYCKKLLSAATPIGKQDYHQVLSSQNAQMTVTSDYKPFPYLHQHPHSQSSLSKEQEGTTANFPVIQ